jgi:hypothetical protein
VPSLKTRFAAAGLAAVHFLVVVPAIAEPTAADRALAQSLFDEGKKLMGEDKYAEACPKLAESQRLDPGLGTLLNLAVCHQKEGKTATAWADFNDAAVQAKKDGRPDREAFAREQIAALDPKLSRLTVTVVPATSSLAGIEVTLDGAKIGKGAWGSSVPVDPGKHTIQASAPGKTAWSGSVDVGPDGDKKAIEIPALADSAVVTTTTPEAPAADTSSGSSRKTIGLVVAGVGVVSLGVGAVFGLRASSKWSERNENCPAGQCNEKAVEAFNDTKSAATIANITIAVGVVAVAAGAVVFLTAPSSSEKKTSIKVAPTLGGLQVLGTF